MSSSHRMLTSHPASSLLATALSVLTGSASLAAPPEPAPKLWVNLGHSTLDQRPPDWAWLRSQCSQGRVLSTLAPVRGQIRGLVVPVFDDGRCFYQTSLPLFRGQNPEAAKDEAALRELLRAARSSGVPVYLGIDPLGWQKDAQRQGGVLQRRPDLQESSYTGNSAVTPSPFHPEVRGELKALVQELGQRFPEAAGLAIDLRMSERSIHGFSIAARSQFIARHQLDPLDFRLDNIAGLRLNPTLRSWVDWRRNQLSALFADLARSYKTQRPSGKVFTSGYAEYYVDPDFHHVRTGQEWLRWLSHPEVDGVLLEGRWLSPFADLDQFPSLQVRFSPYMGTSATTGTIPKGRKPARAKALIPVSAGPHLIKSADYRAEWTALRGRATQVDTVALLVRDDGDLAQVLQFAQGGELKEKQALLAVGSPLPDFVLPGAAGAPWSTKGVRGQRSLDLFLVRDDSQLSPLLAALSARKPAGPNSAETVVIASRPDDRRKWGVTLLRDRGLNVLSRSEAGITRVAVDRAGYVRRLDKLAPRGETLAGTLPPLAADLTPSVEVGQPAPDFTAVDAAGQEVRLRDYRGSKHVLITFFPKCFTDG